MQRNPLSRNLSKFLVLKMTYALWRAGIVAASKNEYTDKSLFATLNIDYSVCLFVSRIQSSKTLSPKGASTIQLIERTLLCVSLKRLDLIKGGTMDSLRLPDLAFRGKVWMSSKLGCIVLPDNALRWQFWGRLTEGTYSPSRLQVAHSE